MVIQTEFNPNVEGTCPMESYGWPNLMMHARASKAYYPEHLGTLSIKTVSRGAETYILQNGRYEVRRGAYLILNHGQYYASQVSANEGMESFCIFFKPGLIENVLGGLVLPDDKLVDDPFIETEMPVWFIEKLYTNDAVLTPHLDYLRTTTLEGPVTPGWLEEQYRFLLEQLLVVHRNVRQEIAGLNATRHTTRVELYRRLHRAKDFMDSTCTENKSLDEIARIACLSTYHFLRTFKEVFGITPHRYLSARKMERATLLLKDSDLPVSVICSEVGFESPGTFSRVFKERYGMTPSQYRLVEQGR